LGSDRPVATAATAIDPALEREYNLRVRHPERGAVYDRFAAASAALRAEVASLETLRYGDTPNSAIDFFAAATDSPAALFVFVHGGYWRALDRRIFSFLARPWLERGVHVALPGYDLAPATTVRAIAGQVRAAVARLLGEAERLRIDPRRVVVSGHSAGAHLGALALDAMPGWSAAGFVGVSGLYELEPLLATSVNLDVALDAAEARALSPSRRTADRRPRYLLAVGGAETDGFRRQSQDYAAALRAQGCEAHALEVPARTHFDVLDDLADAKASLFRGAHALLSRPATGSLP
jgi:arylformamidase